MISRYRKINLLLLSLSIVFVITGCVFKTEIEEVIEKDTIQEEIGLETLMSNPNLYNGKYICTEGDYLVHSEGHFLFYKLPCPEGEICTAIKKIYLGDPNLLEVISMEENKIYGYAKICGKFEYITDLKNKPGEGFGPRGKYSYQISEF